MLDSAEKAACLKRGIFQNLDDEVLLSIAGRMGERNLADGEALFLKGETGDEIFVVVDGEIEIHLGEHVVAVLGPGQLFGEMAVLGGGKRTAGGRARGETRVLFLRDKAIRLLIQQSPALAFAIFKVLIERLDEANRLNRFLSGDRVERGRIEVLAGELAGQSFPLYHEAAVLGRATGGAADALAITLPAGEELRERHAFLTVADGTVFIEPREGTVAVGGVAIEDGVALTPDDRVSLGGLELRFTATETA